MTVIEGAEQYFWHNGEKGVLLIHGYTGSPAELKLLGEYLNKNGYSVFGVRLPGHGTSPEELNNTSWPMWYEAVKKAYDELSESCSEISVIGLSMGGLLSMKLAAELPVKKAVFLAAPIYVYDKRAHLVRFAKFFKKWVKKKSRNYRVDKKYNIAYDVMPLKALDSLMKLIDHCVSKVLPAITVPCLIMQSKQEHTVRPESAELIYEKIPAKDKKLVWVENGGHILTLGDNRDEVFENILSFLEE